MSNSLRKSYLQNPFWAWLLVLAIAGTAASVDAADFKPAQTDLIAVYQQLADKLQDGSPLPYIEHLKSEQARIKTAYKKRFGEEVSGWIPADMDEEYFAQLAKNWNHLSPKLGLDQLSKQFGSGIEIIITANDGTNIPAVLRKHQQRIFAEFQGNGATRFDDLKADLTTKLGLNNSTAPGISDAVRASREIQNSLDSLFKKLSAALPPSDAAELKAALLGMIYDTGRLADAEVRMARVEWALNQTLNPKYTAESETRLTKQEQTALAAFLHKPRFTKADFPALDKFYKETYDKLSEQGQFEMHRRIWEGMSRKK